jgi:hypothetical protein
MDDSVSIEILAQHYRDSFAIVQNCLRLRDRLFAFLLLFASIMLFRVTAPTTAGVIIADLFCKHLGVATAPDVSFLWTVAWLGFLAVLVRYAQVVIQSERLYKYVHGLEDLLSSRYNGKAFIREGRSYLKSYPIFSSFAYWIYTGLFPALVLLLDILKAVQDVRIPSGSNILLLVDLAISLCVLAAVVLYLVAIHLKR